jgi:hypothetical protein
MGKIYLLVYGEKLGKNMTEDKKIARIKSQPNLALVKFT